MAKVTLNINLKKTAKKLFKDKAIFEKIGRYSVKRIKKVTRTGYSMESGRQKKLPPLTEGTIARREILALLNKGIHKDYSPEVSNITMTGQLLNSVKFELKKTLMGIGFVIKVFPDKNKKRRPLKGLRGKPLDNPDNAEIYSDLVSRGFGFLGMDQIGRDKIYKMLKAHLRKELRRLRRK